MGLTPRQEQFAREYVLTGNASEAYRLAYPRSLNFRQVNPRLCRGTTKV